MISRTGELGPVVGVLVTMLLSACGDGNPTLVTGEDDDAGTIKAVGLSPRGFPADYTDLLAFLAEASDLPRGAVLWNGAWRDDVVGGSDSGEPPEAADLVAGQASTYPYDPVLVFGWGPADDVHIAVPSDPTNDWTNEAAGDLYVSMVESFADEYDPPFMFLGNESDEYFAIDPEDYARWVEVYDRAYDAIKAVSPRTLVGPVFQYERMAGIGELAAFSPVPTWGAVQAHGLDKVDIVGLTVYPFFAHPTPEEIPEDYLDALDAYIGGLPIAITESGWPAEDAAGFDPPWVASETNQETFAGVLDDWVSERDVRVVTWLFLHPPVEDAGIDELDWQIFQSLSLRRTNGTPRPVYELWADPDAFGPP